MQTVRLGRTNAQVSVAGLGCGGTAGWAWRGGRMCIRRRLSFAGRSS